jgi:Amt family ammonium transporter
MTSKKPKFIGLLTGGVAGLATITPAAGFVSPPSACLIGVVAGIVCFYAVALKNRMAWDDALDVWGVHGVGGILGTLMLGILATTALNPGGTEGLLHGNMHFFLVQCAALLIASIWAFAFTLGMLWVVDRITPVRVSEETEQMGLDQGLGGETAYL